ncbi:hypothetical protein SCHPADRAFT_994275 [Schizopora paradoxa]|uniref:Uncharacterized protein n=1 Tax=Schizopora paradoxa TaxID=27342 RepID=A0A0H2SKJ9_9AGAM|nr:hypothetical protein SCHPADRAFT_994275 [Schizopora paradoxa]
MALDFPLENSELVSICVESLLYGVYVVLFASCVQVIFVWRRGRNVADRKLLAFTALSLFIFITWHVVVDAVRLYIAFRSINGIPNSAADYYANVSGPLSVMKTSIYVVVTLISDSFILYRSYVVWQRSLYIIAFPFCIFLADLGTGIAAAQGLSKVTTEQTFFIERQDNLTKSFFTVTLALNTICSLLIAAKIYQNQRQLKRSFEDTRFQRPIDGDSLSHIAVIIIESGAIYSSLMVILVGTYAAEITGIFSMFLDMTSPVIGIVFSSIIVRVARGVSHGENGEGASGAPLVSAFVAAEGCSRFADTQLSGETATVIMTADTTVKGKNELSSRSEEKTFCDGEDDEKEGKTDLDDGDALASDGWEKSSLGDGGGYVLETV